MNATSRSPAPLKSLLFRVDEACHSRAATRDCRLGLNVASHASRLSPAFFQRDRAGPTDASEPVQFVHAPILPGPSNLLPRVNCPRARTRVLVALALPGSGCGEEAAVGQQRAPRLGWRLSARNATHSHRTQHVFPIAQAGYPRDAQFASSSPALHCGLQLEHLPKHRSPWRHKQPFIAVILRPAPAWPLAAGRIRLRSAQRLRCLPSHGKSWPTCLPITA